MKHFSPFILLLVCALACAQPPQRQTLDLDETGDELFDKARMGNVEIVTPEEKVIKVNTVLFDMKEQYADWDRNGNVTKLKPQTEPTFDNSFRFYFPQLTEDQYGWKYNYKQCVRFNPSKDDINHYYLIGMHDNFTIVVLNNDNIPVDMSPFTISANVDNMTIVNGSIYMEQCIAAKSKGNPLSYIHGELPQEGSLTLTHQPTGQTTTVPYLISFFDYQYVTSNEAYVIQKIDDKHCRCVELGLGGQKYMRYPITYHISTDKEANVLVFLDENMSEKDIKLSPNNEESRFRIKVIPTSSAVIDDFMKSYSAQAQEKKNFERFMPLEIRLPQSPAAPISSGKKKK